MNRDDAIDALKFITAAWPSAEKWTDDTFEMWIGELMPLDLERAMNVLDAARRHLDFPPTFAWFLAEYQARSPVRDWQPALPPPPTDHDTALRIVREIRSDLHERRSS